MTKNKKVELKYGKSKGPAVALAILLGAWTWVYTWREDYWKFLIALLVNLFLWWTIIVPFGLWIWAMVDVGRRPKEWYEEY